MKIKFLVLLIIVALAVSMLAACNGGDETTVGGTDAPVVTGNVAYPDDTSPIIVDITATTAPETLSTPATTTTSPATTTTAPADTTTEPVTTTTVPDTTTTPETTSPTPTKTDKIEVGTAPETTHTYATVDKTAVDLYDGDLILANKDHALSAEAIAEIETMLEKIPYSENYNRRVNNLKLRAYVLLELEAMCAAMCNDIQSNNLLIQEAYRSVSEQQATYDDNKSKNIENSLWVLPVYHSDYQTALSFRVQLLISGKTYPLNYYGSPVVTQYRKWLEDNAADYGFVLRYPTDKSGITGIDPEADVFHYRFVGKLNALIMDAYDFCLEEYLDFLKTYTLDGEHLYINTLKADGTVDEKYEIYFVPAEADGTTAVSVPDGYDYTVSGNNVDGYIVTVNLTSTAAN